MTTDQPPAPILIVPYVWIGDFVRCHSVVRLLHAQDPARPIDIVSSSLCAPLVDYMPGLRKAIVCDLPRRSMPVPLYRALAGRLKDEHYAQAIMLPRTWKSALAPYLAGIPLRTGFLGEFRYRLLSDIRYGERALPRNIDRMAALALPPNKPLPSQWPAPELRVPEDQIAAWRSARQLPDDGRPIVALAPGATQKTRTWPTEHHARLARELAKDGIVVWIVGGPNETPLAAEIAAGGGGAVRDLTGNDLRNAVLALAAADAAVTNDSGLMHVAAAIGTPTIAIFGPTSPWHWAPLNPVAAILEPPGDEAAKERARTQGNDAVAHRNTADVAVEMVLEATRRVLAGKS